MRWPITEATVPVVFADINLLLFAKVEYGFCSCLLARTRCLINAFSSFFHFVFVKKVPLFGQCINNTRSTRGAKHVQDSRDFMPLGQFGPSFFCIFDALYPLQMFWEVFPVNQLWDGVDLSCCVPTTFAVASEGHCLCFGEEIRHFSSESWVCDRQRRCLSEVVKHVGCKVHVFEVQRLSLGEKSVSDAGGSCVKVCLHFWAWCVLGLVFVINYK